MKRVRIPAISAPLPFLNTIVPSENYFSNLYGLDCTRKEEEIGVYYSFSSEIEEQINTVSRKFHDAFMAATEKIIHNNALLETCGIDKVFWESLRRSWETQREQTIAGRFDFVLDEKNTIKVLEYNADSAGVLLETAVIQRKWAKSMHVTEGKDAGRKLEMALINRWKAMSIPKDDVMHFMIDNDDEEKYNAAYMQEVASAAGLKSKLCIGLDDFVRGDGSRVFHVDGEPVKYVWKMWSWDTVFQSKLSVVDPDKVEKTGVKLHEILLHPDIVVIEPLWKVITTNKVAMLHLGLESPHGLTTSLEVPETGTYFRKPINGRGGKSISVFDSNKNLVESCNGDFDGGKWIYQEAVKQRLLDKRYSTIGSWIVGGDPAGFGVREDTNRIIAHDSPFRAARIVRSTPTADSPTEPPRQ